MHLKPMVAVPKDTGIIPIKKEEKKKEIKTEDTKETENQSIVTKTESGVLAQITSETLTSHTFKQLNRRMSISKLKKL